MKVLIIHTAYRFAGGEDTVVSEEMKLLQANGIEVELLLFDNDANGILKILQLLFNIGSYLRTRKKLLAFQPDVVHVHNLHFAASPSVLYAIKRSGTPVVTTLHNYRFLCPSGTLFNNGKLFLDSLHQQFPWKAITKGAYKNSVLLTFWVALSMHFHNWLGTWKLSDRYIVLTPHARELFLASSNLGFRKKQVLVKPNFCSKPLGQGSTVKEDYFLYVGRLSEEKGIRVLLEAFAATGALLQIAGDGPLKEEVIAFAAKHSNIHYTGTCSKEEVYAMMQQCTALVFPSVWYEGMPLTIIEAFACGTAVIASRLGAMESMVTPGFNGLHFVPENAADLATKVIEWKSLDTSLQETYRSNARKTYQQYYTPEKNLAQLLGIYQSVTNQKQSKRPLQLLPT